MVRNHRIATGQTAEQLALGYLCDQGLRPVARNFRTRRGEIDLIMLDADCLVFVEVRCRNENSFVDARHTVDARKQRKLASAASMYLAKNTRFQNHVCRFDVLAVDLHQDCKTTIDWLQNAFRPGG